MCVYFYELPICAPLTFFQRYFAIKGMKAAERKKVNRRVVFFAGKAAPACTSHIVLSDLYDHQAC